MKKLAALMMALVLSVLFIPAEVGAMAEDSGERHEQNYAGPAPFSVKDYTVKETVKPVAELTPDDPSIEDDEAGSSAVAIRGLGSSRGDVYEKSYDSVEACVEAIVQEMQAKGITGEYNQALWLHDWIVYHANYDYTYTYYTAEGVLLYGTGVCESYTRAYQMLLDQVGIENRMISSSQMNHAWNLVRLEGEWCHIDCTWDDPGTGGHEGYTYFGMNDALMSRDHQWNASGFPAAASLANYYPIRQGSLCYANDAELEVGLAREAAAHSSPITLVYIGSDTEHSAMDAFEQWFNNNYWKYGMTGYSAAYTDYSCVIRITYDGSSNESGNHLDTPVPAPDFDLDSPDGHYLLNRYQNNGVVLIFGQEGCFNTEGLLEGLAPQLSSLNSSGVDVLVCADGAAAAQDLSALQEQYPGFHFTYDSAGLLSGYLQAVGYTSQTVTYPCIFIINKDQKITYYSTGYVSDIDEVAAEAYAVATGSPLPQPEKNDPTWNDKGNVNDIEQGESIAASVQSLSGEHHVILLMGEGVYEEEAQLLSGYEAEYSLLSKLNVSLVASFMEISDEEKAAYPHCTFVDYSNADFLSLLYVAGYEGSSADDCTSMFIQKGGAIQAYTNGSVLSANDCARYAARQVRYAATVPDALTEIGEEAFADTSFESIDLTGGNLQRILSGAFADCTHLTVVRIPESVSEIEEDAFLNCSDLIVVCTLDSAAYRYAQAHGLDCVCE